MAEQLFTDGDVKTVDGHELECVAVTTQQSDSGITYGYHFQLKADVDAHREAEAKAFPVMEETNEEEKQ